MYEGGNKVNMKNNIANSSRKEKNINDIEITCEVFETVEKIKNTLLEKGFKYIESFTLDDIYMYNKDNNQFFIKDGKISDTLIIRNVSEDDKKIVCKKRNYDNDGLEISTDKIVLKVKDIDASEKLLNILGYERYLRMIDTNYMYESENYIAYIQEIKDLGIFLELELKDTNNDSTVYDLINYTKELNLKIGNKFDIRKAEYFYNKINK